MNAPRVCPVCQSAAIEPNGSEGSRAYRCQTCGAVWSMVISEAERAFAVPGGHMTPEQATRWEALAAEQRELDLVHAQLKHRPDDLEGHRVHLEDLAAHKRRLSAFQTEMGWHKLES